MNNVESRKNILHCETRAKQDEFIAYGLYQTLVLRFYDILHSQN